MCSDPKRCRVIGGLSSVESFLDLQMKGGEANGSKYKLDPNCGDFD
jgi:hypothetical protein